MKVLRILYIVAVFLSLLGLSYGASADKTKPTLMSFSVSDSIINEGDTVTINYKVKDSGGSGLNKVELWKGKSKDSLGPIKTDSVSGNGPKEGKFTDRPSPAGTYYYGIHVLDKANNMTADSGAKSVTVKATDTTKPTILLFEVSPGTINEGDSVTINYKVKDSGGSGLNKVELWKGKSKNSLGPIKTDSVSGDGPKEGKFTDKPSPAGTYYYGIHVLDKANNMTADSGAKSVTVKESARPPTTGSVSGKLHKNSASGAVLSGVSVTCGGKSGTTDGNGNFKLDGIAVGNTTLAFSKTGFEPFQSNISIVAGKTVNIGDGWLKEKVSPSDSTKPVVSSFNLNKSEAKVGEPITISYSVSDSGGSGLKQVELWRSPNNKDWTEITTQRRTGLSGNGPISGSFTDTLSAAGTYYYGAHVVDNAGNWSGEGGPKKVTVGPVVSPPRNIPLISCGSKWYQRYGLQVVEIEQAMRGGYSFDLACQNHDACYDDCKTPKADCDKKLRVDAEQTCGSARKGHEQDCVTDARIFFDYVSAKGDAAFLQARSRCRPTTVTGSVSGKLHKNSASGAVLSGVSVTCGGKSGTTDGNGNFKLDGIAVGNTTLAFSKTGFEPFQSNISIVAGKTVNIGDGWLKEKVSTGDSTKPVVSKFSVDKEKINLGSSVTIYYTVTDSGGSGLKQVELWRSLNNKDWAEIGNKRRVGLSGNGPISGSFTDTPPSAGTYYYGAHIVDNAGNWADEKGPKKVTVDVSSPQPPPTVPPPAAVITPNDIVLAKDDPIGTRYGDKGYCGDSPSVCNKSWNNHFLVPYTGRGDIYGHIQLKGSNLDKITDISTDTNNYGVTIVKESRTKTMLPLRIFANAINENVKPFDEITLTINRNSSLTKKLKVIPGFNEFQIYGQCTWYAWRIARIRNGQNEIDSYNDRRIKAIFSPATKNSPAVLNAPSKRAIIMDGGNHTAYIDDLSIKEVVDKDKKTKTIIYKLIGKDANRDRMGSILPFEVDMKVTMSEDGKTYLGIFYPKVAYDMTRIYY